MPRPYDTPVRYDDASYRYDGEWIGPVGEDPDDLDDVFYALAPTGFAVQVFRSFRAYDTGQSYDSDVAYNGDNGPFAALLDTADADFWADAALATTHSLRYRARTIVMRSGDQLQIGIDTYTVAHTPRRISPSEMRAPLVLNPG